MHVMGNIGAVGCFNGKVGWKLSKMYYTIASLVIKQWKMEVFFFNIFFIILIEVIPTWWKWLWNLVTLSGMELNYENNATSAASIIIVIMTQAKLLL